MDRRPLPQGDEAWFLGLAFFLLLDTIPIDSERAGFCLRGWLPHGVFRGTEGKKCFLGRNGFGTPAHGGYFILSFCLAARTFGGVILLFFFAYPPHLDGGCLARGDEAGRLEIPFALFCSFGQAGTATYLRESLHFIDWIGLDGWDGRKDGWACMGRGVSGHR